MQIERTGRVIFSDAKLSVWEDPGRRSSLEWQKWEREFKRQVFKRIIQQMNRMGWTVAEWDEAENYKPIANNHRSCSYGELKALLEVTGRHIKLEMWQGVNTPTRPDHGGRYEPNKEAVMPYILRLRMERTRRKLRNYLCNVFSGYTFSDKSPTAERLGPGGLTAAQKIEQRIKDCWHYQEDLGHAQITGDADRSADDVRLEHGVSKVYAFDRKGRPVHGTAYYDLNGNWVITAGRYSLYWFYHNELYVNAPSDLRRKRNDRLRRQRLEGEMSKAIKSMNFLRAETIKNILFPAPAQLYLVRNSEGLYHRPQFCGYTQDTTDAGRFTRDEIGSYANHNQLIAVQA